MANISRVCSCGGLIHQLLNLGVQNHYIGSRFRFDIYIYIQQELCAHLRAAKFKRTRKNLIECNVLQQQKLRTGQSHFQQETARCISQDKWRETFKGKPLRCLWDLQHSNETKACELKIIAIKRIVSFD